MTSRLQSSGIAALSFALSAGVLALALTPGLASAATASTDLIELTAPSDRIVQTRRVSAGDLDLSSKADLKKLNARVTRAIGQVCREPGVSHSLIDPDCDAGARRSADQQIAALRSSANMLAAANGATITIVAAR